VAERHRVGAGRQELSGRPRAADAELQHPPCACDATAEAAARSTPCPRAAHIAVAESLHSVTERGELSLEVPRDAGHSGSRPDEGHDLDDVKHASLYRRGPDRGVGVLAVP
jgi:hypothetical protein